MKNSIQSKLFTLCILLVLITSISISIPFYLMSKQEKQHASQIRIHVAFEIIRDDIINQITDYSMQIDRFLSQVPAISWGLRWYNEIEDKRIFYASSTYSSYIIDIGEEFLRFSHLTSADRLQLYSSDKRLLVSYHRNEDEDVLGTYILTRGGQNSYLSIDEYSRFLIKQKAMPNASLPEGLSPEYKKEIPPIVTSEHFREGENIGLRIIAPIFKQKQTVGVLIAETFFTQELIERYAKLSKTEVNIFAGDNWSKGTLPAQVNLEGTESAKWVTHDELLQLGNSTYLSSMIIADKDYHQGKYSFINADGIPVGAITASLSKDTEKKEIRKMLMSVILITLFAIVLSIILAIIFSRKTIYLIHKLTETTSAIADGNLDQPIDVSGKDELGVLARSFAKMRQAIKTQITELNIEIVERREAEATIQKREEEKEILEKQLHQAQKMEAIGTLAGGIAHDFNNILSVIIGYSDILKRKLSDDPNSANSLNQIIIAGNRAKNLVGQILAFSRHDTTKLIPIEPDLIVKEAMELLRASIPTTIQIDQDIEKCGTIIADPTQLHQIVMNLCTNGYHAMRESGGKLKVSLKKVSLEEQDLNTLSLNLSTGPYVQLTISDSGHGMTKATQLKIFDPYFTTKEKGDGTGLGLAVVHGVVKSFGGHISVYSELKEGTTFTLYIPQVGYETANIPKKMLAPTPTGTEHIMLVDDEKSILQMEKEMLEDLGYTVIACDNSRKAYQLFQEQSEDISLLITDMTMPDLNGLELMQKIQIIAPNIPVILCSGFSELINEVEAKQMGVSKYLMKPILQKDLAIAIRDTLDNQDTPTIS